MKKTLLTLAIAFMATNAHAVSISLVGDLGDIAPGTTNGSIDIIVDTAPGGETFENGGIDLALASTNPGVIAFTDATVHQREFFGGFARRWAEDGGTLVARDGDDAFSLLRGLSLNTAGLNGTLGDNADGGSATSFLFATVNYNVIGVGATQLELSPASGIDSFVQQGTPISGVELNGGGISVVPEPTALVLVGLGAVGFVARRRS